MSACAIVSAPQLANRVAGVLLSMQGTSRSWAWFFIRIITQLVGLGTALAGVTMVLVVFKNNNPGSKYWSWHQGIGLTALGRARHS